MKKSVLILAAVAALTLVAGCTATKEEGNGIRSVSVVPSEVTIPEGLSESLSVAVEPSSAQYSIITWASSDRNVATVSKKGTLTGVKAGTATITATINGVSGTCEVTVTPNTTAVTGVTLSAETLKVGIGSSEALLADVLPADAANRKVTWSSSKPSVATVEDGLVSGVSVGECDITVTTEDGGFTATCHVTVEETPIEAISFVNGSSSTLVVEPGSDMTLTVGFNPANPSNKNLTWTTSDASVATVESAGEGQGKVTFTSGKYGAVIITATTEKDSRKAEQSFFVKGAQEMVSLPSGSIYAGRKAHYTFNTAYYTTASNIKWTAGGKTVEGASADIAVPSSGAQTIIVSADFGGVNISTEVSVDAKEWFVNVPLEGVNARNTRPVFNKEQTRAYFVTRGARRLYELNLETGAIGWVADINAEKADNGGQIAVNPVTGDIYCANQNYLFAFDKNGSKKWEVEVKSNNASTAIGSAVAVGNGGEVVFFPCQDGKLHAIKASDGTVLDELPLTIFGHAQLGVYGNNDIIIGGSKGTESTNITFVSFSGGKFGEPTVVEGVAPVDLTDITSLAINQAQTEAYLNCGKVHIIKADLKAKTATDYCPGTTWGYLSSPAIAPNGKLIFAAQLPATVWVVSPDANFSDTKSYFKAYHNASEGNNAHHLLNFTAVAVDTESNFYFFVRDDGSGNNAFFKGVWNGETYTTEPIATIEKQNNDPQGFFNFGGGCLIGGGGSNSQNRILVRCIDAERAKGWSGGGGDVCGTNNANFAWGN